MKMTDYSTTGGPSYGSGTYYHVTRGSTPIVTTTGFNSKSTPTWNVTPDFRKKIRAGTALPGHYYNIIRDQWSTTTNKTPKPGVAYYYTTDQIYYLNAGVAEATGGYLLHGAPGSTFTSGVAYDTLIDKAEAKAIRDFYANAASSDFQALVTAAEAPKTFAMIGQTARRLASAFRGLKKGDISSVSKALGLGGGHKRDLTRRGNTARKRGGLTDFASSTWLEVQYGWKPLLNDISNAAKAASLEWDLIPHDIVIRSGGTRKSDPQYSPGYGTSIQVEGEAKFKVGYVIHLNVLDQSTRNYAGLGLMDVGSVAWELLPYSFVVDWFLPVGAWIQAQNALAGTQFASGTRSILSKVRASATVGGVQGIDFSGGLRCDINSVTFSRSTLAEVPLPSRILQVSNFSEAMGFQRATSGIALLAQAFGR